MSYKAFKYAVLKRADWQCEAVGCDGSDGLTVSHLLKRSLYPALAEDPRAAACMCGPCHSEMERRERQGESTREMLPEARWVEAEALARPRDLPLGGAR